MLQNSKSEKAAPNMHPNKKGDLFNQKISPLQCGGFATPSPGIFYDLMRTFLTSKYSNPKIIH